MILLALAGCAYTLGRPTVTYAERPEPLPIVRTTVDPRWYVPILVEGDGLWAFFVDTGYSYTTCDDGLIFVRVARMIQAGYGPVFNPLERVEAATSALWPWWIGTCALPCAVPGTA